MNLDYNMKNKGVKKPRSKRFDVKLLYWVLGVVVVLLVLSLIYSSSREANGEEGVFPWEGKLFNLGADAVEGDVVDNESYTSNISNVILIVIVLISLIFVIFLIVYYRVNQDNL